MGKIRGEQYKQNIILLMIIDLGLIRAQLIFGPSTLETMNIKATKKNQI